MKKHWIPVLIGIVAAALLTTAACSNSRAEAAKADEAVTLQTYVVPQEYQHDLRSMLSYALGSENLSGRVAEGPSGTLVVVAPPAVQSGIRALLKDLGDVAAPPPATPITLNYWLVVGRPLGSPAAPDGFEVYGDANLTAISPALTRIAATEGPTEFALLERLRLTSMAHEQARIGGRYAQLEQRATTTQDGFVADIQIQLMGQNRLESEVKLQPGQFLVLGQTGFAHVSGKVFDTENPDGVTLYYVVTAEV